MNCLEKYRRKLVREVNRDLGSLAEAPDEEAVHDFRVGVKRLKALYYFLHEIESSLEARDLLKPSRSLSRLIGKIRDAHIAVHLIEDLDEVGPEDSTNLIEALKRKIQHDYGLFQKFAQSAGRLSVRVPTIRATGISERSILRHKPVVLDALLQQIVTVTQNMNDERWHGKRILLKRYHHTLDAFCFCPGHVADETEQRQIRMLEELLGDWHDRVITREILQSLQGVEATSHNAIAIMKKQERLLLGSAKIYLRKFALWHRRS